MPAETGLRFISADDPRLAVVADVFTLTVERLGMATILSPNIAVTPWDVARAEPDKGLRLFFLRLASLPVTTELPAKIEAVDLELGFGVLSISGTLPKPIPPGAIETGETPPQGTECEVLYYEDGLQDYVLIRGQVAGQSGSRFTLDVQWNVSSLVVGCPVFMGSQVIGMVVTGPTAGFDPKYHGLQTSTFVEVLSVGSMAKSKVTEIRKLFRLLEDNQNSPVPFQASPPADSQQVVVSVDDDGTDGESRSARSELIEAEVDTAPAYAPLPEIPGLDFPGHPSLSDPLNPIVATPVAKVDSDLYCDQDHLGYEAYARTIASLITHKETKPPLTIGIKAPWGAGKTSLMKRVQHLLDGSAKLSEENRAATMQQGQPSQVTLRELLKVLKSGAKPERLEPKRSEEGRRYGLEARITVWFNAWKYQTSEQIWAGMAHCIISQITARMGVKERELFWLRLHARRVSADEVRRKVYEMLARQLLPLALVVVIACAMVIWIETAIPSLPWRLVTQGLSGLAGLITLVWSGWDKLGEKAAGTVRDLIREPNYEGKMGYLHLVESDIREVLQLATATKENPKGDPLVVFVDDLDRCAPNKVAEVVEAINLFLCGDYPNCIFVLGMEPGMVAAAMEVANKDVIEKAIEMGLVDQAAPVGWRFMEKIVQLPIMIPPPTRAGRISYLESLTGSPVGVVDDVKTSDGPVLARLLGAPLQFSKPSKHGVEEEAKVQSYIEKIGTPSSVSDAVNKSDKVVTQASQEDQWAVREAAIRTYEKTLSETDPAMAGFAQEVAELVDGNPRQVKRYVNVFRFYCTLRKSLELQNGVPMIALPSDKVLAKFVALSIHWPHAVDYLRRKKDVDGKQMSVLALLETESMKTVEDAGKVDEDWKQFVGKSGLGLGAWAEQRTFREFLSRGVPLCKNEGHGLW